MPSRRRNISGISVSIVVFELGTIWPMRYWDVLIARLRVRLQAPGFRKSQIALLAWSPSEAWSLVDLPHRRRCRRRNANHADVVLDRDRGPEGLRDVLDELE